MKLIAFDYDGVIVDSMTLNRKITNDVCRELAPGARTITQDDIENLNHMSFQEVSKVIGVPDEIIPACLALINKKLVESYSQLSVFEGIVDLIKKLSLSGNIIAIVTHNTEEAVHSLMKKQNIDKYFHAIMGAEQEGEKDDKLLKLQAEFNIPSASCYMIGDSVGDISAGKSAKCNSIAVSWGFQSLKRLKTLKPEFVVHTPAEIYEIIK